MRLVSHRYDQLLRESWPSLCYRRFSPISPSHCVPPALMWALLAVDRYDEATIARCLSALNALEARWPGAITISDEGSNNRMQQMRSLPGGSIRLPADAALFLVLGISLEAASPIANLSGDFGEKFAEDTPREPWRLALTWPPLNEYAVTVMEDPAADPDAAADPAAGNAGNAADPAAAGAAEAAAADDEADDDGEEYAASLGGAYALALARSLAVGGLQQPQTLADFGAFYGHPIGEDSEVGAHYDFIYRRAESLVLVGQFALSSSAGAHLPLYLDCDPSASSGAPGGAPGGALHCCTFDTDAGDGETDDYRFSWYIDGEPLTLTGLLEEMSDELALNGVEDADEYYTARGHKPFTWKECWHHTDFFGAMCDRIDNSCEKDDPFWSCSEAEEEQDDEAGEEGDDEEDAGSVVSEEDAYPASMLGDAEQ